MLNGYDGALILVSHDRYLLGQVTQRTVEVADGGARVVNVGYTEYRQKSMRAAGQAGSFDPARGRIDAGGGKRVAAVEPAAITDLDRLRAMNSHQLSKERVRARARVSEAEQMVEKLEAELSEIIAGLSRPSGEAVDLARRHGEVQLKLEEAIAAWEAAATYADLAEGA
jgi:ATPase subunit of ABC transporter with duplicated ATPase domains